MTKLDTTNINQSNESIIGKAKGKLKGTSASMIAMLIGGMGLSIVGGGTAKATHLCGTPAATTGGGILMVCSGSGVGSVIFSPVVTSIDRALLTSSYLVTNGGSFSFPALSIPGSGGTSSSNALAVTLATGGFVGLINTIGDVSKISKGSDAFHVEDINVLNLTVNGTINGEANLTKLTFISTTGTSKTTFSPTGFFTKTTIGQYGDDGLDVNNVGSLNC